MMVIAVDDTDTADGNICVVTGSKDHYIKVRVVFHKEVVKVSRHIQATYELHEHLI